MSQGFTKGINIPVPASQGGTGATGGIMRDANGNIAFSWGSTASAVNYLTLINNSTGNAPVLNVNGSDANIHLGLQSKGTGGYRFFGTSSTAAFTDYFENDTNGANYIRVIAPASIAVNQTVTWKSASSGYPVLDSVDSDDWTSFTPGVTGFASTSALIGKYKKIGKTVIVYLTISGTANANGFTVTGLPFTLADGVWQGFHFCTDNSVNNICSASITGTTATLYLGTNSQVSGWTASGSRTFNGRFVYQST